MLFVFAKIKKIFNVSSTVIKENINGTHSIQLGVQSYTIGLMTENCRLLKKKKKRKLPE